MYFINFFMWIKALVMAQVETKSALLQVSIEDAKALLLQEKQPRYRDIEGDE